MQPRYEVPHAPSADRDPSVLRNIVILSWVNAFLCLVCGGGLTFIYAAWPQLFGPAIESGSRQPYSPEMTAALNQQMGMAAVTIGLGTLVFVVANVASALMVKRRKNIAACIAASALNMIAIPIGTAIGLYSLINLSKPEIRALFEG